MYVIGSHGTYDRVARQTVKFKSIYGTNLICGRIMYTESIGIQLNRFEDFKYDFISNRFIAVVYKHT